MIREGWHKRVTIDILVWVIAALLCMLWRWVANKSEMVHYWALFGVLAATWIVVGLAEVGECLSDGAHNVTPVLKMAIS